MAFKKTKGQGGEAKRYVTRTKATRLLQLGLPEFRRLCILKGIYPREPASRKKAQKGDTTIKTLFLKRDIAFLAHEPIIWKIRDEKVFRRKLRTLVSTKEGKEASFHKVFRKPTYRLDHMVRERYPSFQHAVQDLDDPLSSCFLYACFAKEKGIRIDLVNLCRRLTLEFLSYVIEAKALRKVFVTIKGYFYRAHIHGEKVTWIMPHSFHPEIPKFADIRIMGTFIEFYCTMIGFVNYKLFQSLNLNYPPTITTEIKKAKKKVATIEEELINKVESLNIPLTRAYVDTPTVNDDDTYDMELMSLSNDKKLKLAQKEQDKVKRQIKLFENSKFFLGRETNRESLTFVIRSAGGLVSWDESCGPGHTFTEDDKSISYQICDRPTIEKKYITRYYVQPQWVYDSFNNGILLPVQDYFVGTELPAHLSPFEETYSATYTPPEMQRLKALLNEIQLVGDAKPGEHDDEVSSSEDDEDEESEEDDNIPDPRDMIEKEDVKLSMEEELLGKMKVKKGKPMKRNLAEEKQRKDKEDYGLATTFIHRKQKRLFRRIAGQEKDVNRRGEDLKRKRLLYEKEMQKRRKLAKKALNQSNTVAV